jgi:uncharacterized protein (TIGR03067 family)
LISDLSLEQQTMSQIPFEHALDGLWQMVRAELAGVQAPELVAQRTTVEFSHDIYRVRFDGEIVDQGRFQIGPAKPHRSLQLFGTSGPNEGRTISCIFQHVGDRLRVCYGLDGFQPTEFTTITGENRYLATYRRAAL